MADGSLGLFEREDGKGSRRRAAAVSPALALYDPELYALGVDII
jgi:hypothetical protein